MTLRWGIVAAGKISHDFVNALNSYPEKRDQAIVAIAARDKNRAAEFAKVHNIEKVFDSYEALAKSNDVGKQYISLSVVGVKTTEPIAIKLTTVIDDIVRKVYKQKKYVIYIGALNSDHYRLTKLYLENGKHVLCEKPFCLNYKQAQSLIDLAKKKNLFVMEAIWSRFSSAYIDLEKDINSGKLGDLKFLEANFGIYTELDRVCKKEQGGSTVLDLGIYLLNLSQYVFKDEPIKVTAVGKLFDTGVDEAETIILEYSGDRKAVLNVNSRLWLWNKATIYGTKGRITLEDPFHFPHKLTNVDGSVKEYAFHTSKIPYNFENSAGLAYQAVEVARCIKEGLLESPRVSHKTSLQLAKLMDTIRKQLGVHYDVDDEQY